MMNQNHVYTSSGSSSARRSIKLFGTVLIVLYCLAIGIFACFPKLKSIDELSQKQKEIKRKLDKAKKNDKQLSHYRRKFKELGGKINIIEEILPPKMKTKSLLKDISSAMHECNLVVLRLHPHPERKNQFYSEMLVEVKVSGSINNTMLLFDRIIEWPRLVTINNLVVDSTPHDPLMSVSFNATAYRYVDSKDAELNMKKKKRELKKADFRHFFRKLFRKAFHLLSPISHSE